MLYRRPRLLVAVALVAWALLPARQAEGQRPTEVTGGGPSLPATDTARVKPGTLAPDFTLEAFRGPALTLSQFRGKKNIILVFYRGHW